MLFQRVLKFLVIIGLLIILLLMGEVKARMGMKNKFIVLLSKYRALLPYIVAQAKLETGNFTSRVYLTDNNMFGMKLPVKRSTVATAGLMSPEGNNYAHYSSDADSLKDLLLWFDYTKFPVSVNSSLEYAERLKERSYYGASLALYNKNLEYWLKS